MAIILPLIDIVDYTVCKMLKPLSFRGSSLPPPPLGPPRLLVVHSLFQKTWLRPFNGRYEIRDTGLFLAVVY
jgi:hypothetical protein